MLALWVVGGGGGTAAKVLFGSETEIDCPPPAVDWLRFAICAQPVRATQEANRSRRNRGCIKVSLEKMGLVLDSTAGAAWGFDAGQ